jgi:hypothetical protein
MLSVLPGAHSKQERDEEATDLERPSGRRGADRGRAGAGGRMVAVGRLPRVSFRKRKGGVVNDPVTRANVVLGVIPREGLKRTRARFSF